MELVSIITPSFNGIKYVGETYKSIQAQTYQNWEWMVTDDCSTDGTYEYLLELAKLDPRIKIFQNIINEGAAVSRNNSIKKASGRFVSFIDSDDLWLPSKLETQIKFMLEKSADFSFTSYELICENGNSLNSKVDTHNIKSVSYEDMLRKKATLGCSTVMLRVAAFNDISMPLIRTGQDYGLWLKLLRDGANAFHLNEVLTSYRILPNSISRNKVKKAIRQWEIYRRIESLSLFKSVECFLFYAWRAVFRS